MTPAPNRADLAAYLDMIFGYCDAGDSADPLYCIALRGLGEKGTDGEGGFRDIHIVPPIQSIFDVDRIFGHVQRWSQHGRASFVVPAAVAPVALSDPHATEDRIMLLTTMVVDIDKGNTDEKLAHAVKYIGQPSMVVLSGGTTETDHPKLHVYWRLNEASPDVERIAASRKLLALKVGGDAAFGRSTQVIRLPGSIYNKNDVARVCRIDRTTTAEYELNELIQAIEAMPVADGVTVDAAKLASSTPGMLSTFGSGLKFSPTFETGSVKTDIKETLNNDIHEGGEDDRNRWSECGRTMGFYISQARTGVLTLEEARLQAMTWAELKQKPPFPKSRLDGEWKSLITLDVRNHGPMPGTRAVEKATQKKRKPLKDWAIEKWAVGKPPLPRFIVPGLIKAGTQHIICSEGSVGKTYILIDLIMKIAMKRRGDGATWLGHRLDDTEADGAAVLLTMEDSAEDIHSRIFNLCPDEEKRKMCNERALIRPYLSDGGAIRFLERQRGTQSAIPTTGWAEALDELREVPDLKLVVIDTLNSTIHDDENNATVINEFMQAVAPVVCGELGAALIITHHPRKAGNGGHSSIYTPKDYLNEMRGSGALAASFRAVLGIWQRPDYSRIMRLMGCEPRPNRMFYFGVCKANPAGFLAPDDTLTLLKNEKTNMLEDVTEKAREVRATEDEIQRSWLIKAVEVFAANGTPLRTNGEKGAYARLAQLPLALRDKKMTRDRLTDIINKSVTQSLLVRSAGGLLDIPGGFLDRNEGRDGGAYVADDDAPWTLPDWEREFLFDPVHFRVVDYDNIHPVTRSRLAK